MNMRLSHGIVILVIVCAFAFPFAVLAQEVTPTVEPTADTPAVVVVDVPDAPPEHTVPIPTSTLNLALLVGGAILVVTQIIKSIEKGRVDKQVKDDTERFYKALPPEWQTVILSLVQRGQGILDFLEEVTDGEPNTETPTTTTVTTTTVTPSPVDTETVVG